MAFARNVPGLGSVVSTESNQSSENRHLDASREEERQRTGLYRRDDSENLMPPWSVPPGLIVPGPRLPEADAPQSVPGPEPAVVAPAADDDSWPGVAAPAVWFLRAPRPPAAQPESAQPESAQPESAQPESAQPESAPARDTEGDLPGEWFTPPALDDASLDASLDDASLDDAVPDAPVLDLTTTDEASAEPGPRAPAPAAPASLQPTASPWPTGGAWPNASPVPSPTREPNGSWSSPLTPGPLRVLGPTRARYGRAGGPGFQPARSGLPRAQDAGSQAVGPHGAGSRGAGPSPWQRSHQRWAEAGIQWEQPPAPQPPAPQARPYPSPAAARQAPPPAPPRQAPGQHIRPGSYASAGPGSHAPEPAAVGWPGRMQVPLGAPVFSAPRVDEDDGPAREDRWGDDRPPIWERPPGLVPPAVPERARLAEADAGRRHPPA